MNTEPPKHTPGPWEISGDSIVSGDTCIANIETDGGYEASSEEREANSSLISSAPELLSALEDLLEIGQSKAVFHVAECNMARSAIAKAKGLRP